MPVVAQQSGRAERQSKIYQEHGSWVEVVTGSLSASPAMTVKVRNVNVTVQGGNHREITYTLKKWAHAITEAAARRELRRYRFAATTSGGTALIRAGAIGEPRNRMASELTMQVPRSIGVVKLITRGGNDVVTGIGGDVDVIAGGGNLRLDDIGGDVVASTMGGNVEVGTTEGNLTLKTAGGSVKINAVKGQIVTHSGGGNIDIGSGAQGVVAHTAGGAIEVKHCGGELKAHTGGGNIRLTSASGPVVANTTGGTIELYGLSRGAQVRSGGGRIVAEFLANNGSGESSLQTPAGDIIVYLAPGLKATIRATIDLANGRRIRSDFPQIKVSSEGGQYGPKALYAEGNLNGGGPPLQVRTSNGDIEFRRAKSR